MNTFFFNSLRKTCRPNTLSLFLKILKKIATNHTTYLKTVTMKIFLNKFWMSLLLSFLKWNCSTRRIFSRTVFKGTSLGMLPSPKRENITSLMVSHHSWRCILPFFKPCKLKDLCISQFFCILTRNYQVFQLFSNLTCTLKAYFSKILNP